MMRYSVWNHRSRSYDYYDAPHDGGVHAGAPPRASSSSLGATPDQAAWPLPAMAIRVGSGDVPQGRIASDQPEGIKIDWLKSVAYGVIGYALWKVMR